MNTINPKELKHHVGERIRMHGCIYKIRKMKDFAFVLLRTKRDVLQCIYTPEKASFSLDVLKEESAVEITADVISEERSKTGYELQLLNVSLPEIKEIPEIRFSEAKERIARTYRREIHDWDDFEPEEEKLLCRLVQEETGSDFVFVTHYPTKKRPFYAMDSRENPEETESFDLLFRGLEVTTGGQRIHAFSEQAAKMERLHMNVELFDSYLMMHRCGIPPHGGLGIGLERFTARLLELDNVRLATLFPRDLHRLQP